MQNRQAFEVPDQLRKEYENDPPMVDTQRTMSILGYSSIQGVTKLVDDGEIHAYYYRQGELMERKPHENIRGRSLMFFLDEVLYVLHRMQSGDLVRRTGPATKSHSQYDKQGNYLQWYYNNVTKPERKRKAAAAKAAAEAKRQIIE